MFVLCVRELDPISDHDLHWLAGLIEGEGTFLAGPPSAPRTPAVVLSCGFDRDIVERAGTLLGVSVQVVPSRRENWRTAYCVRVQGRSRGSLDEPAATPNGRPSARAIVRAIASYGPDPRRVLDDMRATDALRRLAAGDRFQPQVAERLGQHLVDVRPAAGSYLPAPSAAGLAVLVLVRHSACFAALFGHRASWGDDAQDSHCLQAQGEAFAAVG